MQGYLVFYIASTGTTEEILREKKKTNDCLVKEWSRNREEEDHRKGIDE